MSNIFNTFQPLPQVFSCDSTEGVETNILRGKNWGRVLGPHKILCKNLVAPAFLGEFELFVNRAVLYWPLEKRALWVETHGGGDKNLGKCVEKEKRGIFF